jgi:hypothetical protein
MEKLQVLAEELPDPASHDDARLRKMVEEVRWAAKAFVALADSKQLRDSWSEVERSLAEEPPFFRRSYEQFFRLVARARNTRKPLNGATLGGLQALITTLGSALAVIWGRERSLSDLWTTWVLGSGPSATGRAPSVANAASHLDLVVAFVHLVFCALIIALWYQGPLKENLKPPHRRLFEVAFQAWEQYRAACRRTIYAWSALYSTVLLSTWVTHGLVQVALIAINTFSAWTLFDCYLVLDKQSVPSPRNPNRSSPYRTALAWSVFGATTVGLVGVFSIFVSDSEQWWAPKMFQIPAAVYGAIALCLLVGRLDSHWFAIPRSHVAALYLYALIQVAFPLLDRVPIGVRTALFLYALLGKVLLAIHTVRIMKNGALADYMAAAEVGLIGSRMRVLDSWDDTSVAVESMARAARQKVLVLANWDALGQENRKDLQRRLEQARQRNVDVSFERLGNHGGCPPHFVCVIDDAHALVLFRDSEVTHGGWTSNRCAFRPSRSPGSLHRDHPSRVISIGA